MPANSNSDNGPPDVAEPEMQVPDFGNWVPSRLVQIFGGLTIACLGLFLVFWPFLFGAILFFLMFCYLLYARFRFSPRGGDLQGKIRGLVMDHLEWDGRGRVVDIGCGNAPLTIELAKRFPSASVVGIDYWGGKWNYSMKVCERNAEVEGVSDRVSFQKASASALPFEDEYFDAAVSNLVFHEVSDVDCKRQVVREALRVVKRGGTFAFQDLFLEKRIYGEVSQLLDEMRQWGVQDVEFLDTSQSDFVPRALKLRFMLGAIGIVKGTK